MSTPDPTLPPQAQPAVAPPPTTAPKAPSVWSKIWHGFLAAVTSPTAVDKERSLAAFVVTRVLLAAGASASLAAVVEKIVGG